MRLQAENVVGLVLLFCEGSGGEVDVDSSFVAIVALH